jgi:hypothetical protein
LDGELFDFTTKITKNLTLTARWTEAADITEVPAALPPLSTDSHPHNWYIMGRGIDGAVYAAPEGSMTRAEAAMIFYRLYATPETLSQLPLFPDVANPEAWYYDAVTALAERGLLLGRDGGLYQPNAPISRAELVTIVARTENELRYHITGGGERYHDVSPGHWAYANLMSASEKGYIDGYEDGSFRPDDNITRAEAIKVINGLLNRRHFDTTLQDTFADYYPDLLPSYWAFHDVIEASIRHEYDRDSAGLEVWRDEETLSSKAEANP